MQNGSALRTSMRMVLSSPGAPQRQAVSQLHEDLKTGGGKIRVCILFFIHIFVVLVVVVWVSWWVHYRTPGNRNSWSTANFLDYLSSKEENEDSGMMNWWSFSLWQVPSSLSLTYHQPHYPVESLEVNTRTQTLLRFSSLKLLQTSDLNCAYTHPMHKRARAHTHTQTHKHTYTHTHTLAHNLTGTNTDIDTEMYTNTHSHTLKLTHKHTHTHTLVVCFLMYKDIRILLCNTISERISFCAVTFCDYYNLLSLYIYEPS